MDLTEAAAYLPPSAYAPGIDLLPRPGDRHWAGGARPTAGPGSAAAGMICKYMKRMMNILLNIQKMRGILRVLNDGAVS